MALKEFVGYMDDMREIGRAGAMLERGDDIAKKDKAYAYLDKVGIETLSETVPGYNPKDLTPEERRNHVNRGVALKQKKLNEQAGKAISGKNLESTLEEIGSKSLEELALREEIAKGGVKGYDDLLRRYGGYRGARQFEDNYNAGKISPEDLKKSGIYALAADEIAKEVVEKNKGEFSRDTLDSMSDAIKMVVGSMGTDKKDYLGKAVKTLVGKSEKEFRDEEEKSKKRVIDYVIESLKKMRESDDAEDAAVARSLIYSAATAAKKDSP